MPAVVRQPPAPPRPPAPPITGGGGDGGSRRPPAPRAGSRFGLFDVLRQILLEMRLVSWSSRSSILQNSVLYFCVTVVLTGAVVGLDLGFTTLVRALIG